MKREITIKFSTFFFLRDCIEETLRHGIVLQELKKFSALSEFVSKGIELSSLGSDLEGDDKDIVLKFED